ncbi:MAG TPA: hypothetical protein VI456_16320 [Polyangia bacterium]
MNRTAASRLSGLVLGGLLVVGPTVARADADAPMSAQEADQMAQAAEQQAEQAKQMGGVGYKTGAVQRAEADATRYSSLAADTGTPAQVISPEAQHYAKLADQYKLMGGVGYKTGLVQRAEADQHRAEARAAETTTQPTAVPASSPQKTYPDACNSDDPWMQPLECWK